MWKKDADPSLNRIYSEKCSANRVAMNTLEELAVEKLPPKDMKQAMQMYWWNFRRYHKLVESKLTYWQMQQWSESLQWNHPVARWLDHNAIETRPTESPGQCDHEDE